MWLSKKFEELLFKWRDRFFYLWDEKRYLRAIFTFLIPVILGDSANGPMYIVRRIVACGTCDDIVHQIAELQNEDDI